MIPPVDFRTVTTGASVNEKADVQEQEFSKRTDSSDVWVKRAVVVAIVFVTSVGSLSWYGYRRTGGDVAAALPRVIPLTSSAGNEFDPAVSPDGNQVAFARVLEGEENEDIYIRQLQSETPLRLTKHPLPDRHPKWSPDGQWIAFVRGEGDDCNIFIIASLGGFERKLAPLFVAAFRG